MRPEPEFHPIVGTNGIYRVLREAALILLWAVIIMESLSRGWSWPQNGVLNNVREIQNRISQ